MHWHKIPNIWTRQIELGSRVLPRVKEFRPTNFDFNRAGEKCRIRVHYKNFNGNPDVLECTVAEAIQHLLRPGRWIVPKAYPSEVQETLEKTATKSVDYRNNEPYSAILDYVLVNLKPELGPTSAMARRRGPQMFLLNCFPDFPHQEYDVITRAFEAISTGKVSTIAIFSKYKFKSQIRKARQTMISARNLDGSISPGNRLDTADTGAGYVLGVNDKPVSDAVALEIEEVVDNLDIDPDIVGSDATLEIPVVSEDEFYELWQFDMLEDELFRQSSRLEKAKSLEQDQQARIRSYRKSKQGVISQKEDAAATSAVRTDLQEEVDSQSYDGLYSSRYSSVDSVNTDILDTDIVQLKNSKVQNYVKTLQDGHSKDSNLVTDNNGEQNEQPEALLLNAPDQSESLHGDRKPTDKEYTQVKDIPLKNTTVNISEPFGKQFLDPELFLYFNKQNKSLRGSQGTIKVLAWATKYMPHLWPTVVKACMPEGSKIEIEAKTDRGSIQYVIAPPLEMAVKSFVKDHEYRDSEDWL